MAHSVILKIGTIAKARIGVNTWQKGYPEQRELMTLRELKVHKKHQGQGVGKTMVLVILDWMRRNGINHIVFDNYDKGFWDSAAKEHDGYIAFNKSKRHGIIYIEYVDINKVLHG